MDGNLEKNHKSLVQKKRERPPIPSVKRRENTTQPAKDDEQRCSNL